MKPDMHKAAMANWPTTVLKTFVNVTGPRKFQGLDEAMAAHAGLAQDHPLKLKESMLSELFQIASAILDRRAHFSREYERDLVALGCELAHVPASDRHPVWLFPSATVQRIAHRCGMVLVNAFPMQSALQLAVQLDRDLVTMWNIGSEPEFAWHVAHDLPGEPLDLGDWSRQAWVHCWGGEGLEELANYV